MALMSPTCVPIFYDTHAHLDYPDFAEELPTVIAQAHAAGIAKIISIGTDLESSKRAIRLAEQFSNVFAVVGWHPSHVTQAPPDIRPALRELARHPKVVALGETGLDYHRLPSQKPEFTATDDERTKRNRRAVPQHLEVAAELELNCVIHQRDSLETPLPSCGLTLSACGAYSIVSRTTRQRCGAFWRWVRS